MNVSFVILHYRTCADTIECIESLKQIEGNFDIVIVDNASNNGSIETLENKYGQENRFYILKNKSNLGFSAGNNVGYSFAKSELNADFIIVLNNDIVIKDHEFLNSLMKFYARHKFYICGPDIESLADGKHQNPKEDSIPNLRTARKERIRYLFLYLISRAGVYDWLKKIRTTATNEINSKTLTLCHNQEYIDNAMLHGSFVIFSPLYIENEKYAFQPGPFLYCEEAILYRYCKIRNYLMTYYSKIKVYHKEDSSTNSLCDTSKAKREFIFLNMFKSIGFLIDIYKREKNE